MPPPSRSAARRRPAHPQNGFGQGRPAPAVAAAAAWCHSSARASPRRAMACCARRRCRPLRAASLLPALVVDALAPCPSDFVRASRLFPERNSCSSGLSVTERGTSALLTRFQWQLEDEMKIHAAMTVAALALAPTLTFAQSATVEGARSGAAAGTAVGGPVGGAVGGTVGAAVGTAVDIPAAVFSAVTGCPDPRWWCASAWWSASRCPSMSKCAGAEPHRVPLCGGHDRRVIVEAAHPPRDPRHRVFDA